jgi:hypothetical protein
LRWTIPLFGLLISPQKLLQRLLEEAVLEGRRWVAQMV